VNNFISSSLAVKMIQNPAKRFGMKNAPSAVASIYNTTFTGRRWMLFVGSSHKYLSESYSAERRLRIGTRTEASIF